MGTLCKNCPLKNIHKETGEDCTIVFVQRYKNSCVTYDLAEHEFEKELKKMSDDKKEKLDQLAKDMAEYQIEKEQKKSSTKKSAPKKPSASRLRSTKKEPKLVRTDDEGRDSQEDSVRVQEVCETA